MGTGSVWLRCARLSLVFALGVVALRFGVASVLLDHATHQPGTGGPVADTVVMAAGVVPATAVGMLLAAGGNVRITADGSLANPSPHVIRVLSAVVIVGTLISWSAWLASQIPTYRHASGVHRQQLKWLYSSAAIFVLAYFGVFIAALRRPGPSLVVQTGSPTTQGKATTSTRSSR